MDALQRFFRYDKQLDRRGESLLGRESSLFLFASAISRKPLKMINIGIGSGDVALTLLFARDAYLNSQLICLQPAAVEETIEPQLLAQLESASVSVIRCVDWESPKLEGLHAACDLIAVDLSKINTTADLPSILTLAHEDALIFLYAGVAADKQNLLAEAAALLSRSEWRIDLSTRWVSSESPRQPDMLVVQKQSPGGARHHLTKASGSAPAPNDTTATPIHLALPPPANTFGWGVCSHYLSKELAKLCSVHVLTEAEAAALRRPLKGKVFHAFTGIQFESIFEQARGEQNYAYTFFENELPPQSVENAKRYDLVLGGSTWCLERMQEKGIDNSGVLIQGIDPQFFYPITTPKSQDKFVLFSGGKFEPRKGQDLVLAAFKALQAKYPDIFLVTCWHNLWPQSMDLMASSKWIRYERKGDSWSDIMNHIYSLNGLDPERIFTIDLVPNETQRDLYRKTDLGIFPNRCEGGTNLVLMEYMACAKPVIGAYSTGQRDVLSARNALLLEDIRPYEVKGPGGTRMASWTEPCLDELIAQIEYAYVHRDRIAVLGRQAGEDLRKLTWTHSAKSLLRSMGEAVED
jgi:glycosyltransferase involved in cell wall biosynthesis/predicted O-methyltransferase YrrM